MNGSCQNCGGRHMANTDQCNGSTKGAWIFQFLLPLHQRFHVYHKTATQAYAKRPRMAVGNRRTKCVQCLKEMCNNGTCMLRSRTHFIFLTYLTHHPYVPNPHDSS